MTDSTDKTTSVSLTDTELVLLDGRCSDKAQTVVDSAKLRLAMIAELDGLEPHLAALLSDILDHATKNGLLRYVHTKTGWCSYCRTKPEPAYVPYKSGMNKGAPNFKKPRFLSGVDFSAGSVSVRNHISVGACSDCVAAIRDELVTRLADVEAQLPTQLMVEGATQRLKVGHRKCKECGWAGHDAEMIYLPAVMNGWYPGECPDCGAQKVAFSDGPFETVDGFTIVDANDKGYPAGLVTGRIN